MPIDRARCRQLLREAQFESLFIEELGWDRSGGNLSITINGEDWALTGVAQKRWMPVYTCVPPKNGRMPDHLTRNKIEAQATKWAYEHLIIYLDASKATHTWQRAHLHAGPLPVRRKRTYRQGQPGDSLIQWLEYIGLGLDEEAELT